MKNTAPAITAVLFDLDGTLLDTAPDLVFALNAALAEAGLPPCAATAVKPHISGGARAMLGHALGRPVAAAGEPLLQRMLDLYQTHLADRTGLFEGMDTVLAELDARGLPWGIVTNKRRRFTDPLAAALRLTPRTACIVSGDTTAECKPHPLPLLEASRRLGHAPERCVYIGDAAKDMEAGRRAGMTTLAAWYGYIAADDNPLGWGADGHIHRPLDLLAWLDGGTQP
ncbi:HAD family hydrolase [Methylomagnum ishizawai]|uniref:HAD family hydrolase n=1 Tax=Methylomagnum ishizawai TaxID=1760988 RepID=UPI001C33342D|nr:HAD-IA family hydrolase [Methylomagnum ishizawai]BBL75642.1 phosphoglycolate phosphatase, bacterial [Methylomagnum ishizawai]